MAYDPNTYKAPRVSRVQKLLDNHGYTFGRTVNGVQSLIPTRTRWMSLMDYINPECTPEELTTMYVYGRYDFALYSEPNENLRDWFLRLGWLVKRDGHIVEAD